MTPETVTVTAQGVGGVTYRLHYTDGLAPASWQSVAGSAQVAATNGVVTLQHTEPVARPPYRHYHTQYVSGP